MEEKKVNFNIIASVFRHKKTAGDNSTNRFSMINQIPQNATVTFAAVHGE